VRGLSAISAALVAIGFAAASCLAPPASAQEAPPLLGGEAIAPGAEKSPVGELQQEIARFQAHATEWSAKAVDLTLTEFWLVHSLARYPGHVKDRESLMRDAHIVVDDSTITSHVKRIRRKFQTVDGAFNAIDSVYGLGYRWNS